MKLIENAPIGLFVGFFLVLAIIVMVATTLFSVGTKILNEKYLNDDLQVESRDFIPFWRDFEFKAMQVEQFNKDGILSKEEYKLFLTEFLKRFELTYAESGKKLFGKDHIRVDILKARCYLTGYQYEQPFLVVSC